MSKFFKKLSVGFVVVIVVVCLFVVVLVHTSCLNICRVKTELPMGDGGRYSYFKKRNGGIFPLLRF